MFVHVNGAAEQLTDGPVSRGSGNMLIASNFNKSLDNWLNVMIFYTKLQNKKKCVFFSFVVVIFLIFFYTTYLMRFSLTIAPFRICWIFIQTKDLDFQIFAPLFQLKFLLAYLTSIQQLPVTYSDSS